MRMVLRPYKDINGSWAGCFGGNERTRKCGLFAAISQQSRGNAEKRHGYADISKRLAAAFRDLLRKNMVTIVLLWKRGFEGMGKACYLFPYHF